MENPLLSASLQVPFDRIQAEHIQPAIKELLARSETALDAIEKAPRTYAGTLGALESATEQLEFSMGIVEHLESVATTPALRDAYNAVLPDVSAFWSSVSLREGLYRALEEFSQTAEAQALDATRRRLLDKTLADFRRQGAQLPPADKEKLKELDRELSVLTTKFSQNVLDATNAFELVIEDEKRLSGLPESAKTMAKEAATAKGKTGYRFTLQAPSVNAVLTYADDAELRRQIWIAYNARGAGGEHDNRPLIGKLLELRRARARLLGFKDFADLVTDDRMAKSGKTAQQFIADLTEKSLDAFEREKQELAEFAASQGAKLPLLPWDVGYYVEKLRKARFELDEEELRAYFPAERALKGAFEVAERLYGVSIAQLSGVPVWDPSVTTFEIKSEDGARLGIFHVDLYPRENKRGGAWMHGLLASVPPAPNLAVFCCNSSPPSGGKPSLLLHRDVETLFHEFGHLLHHCLSRVSVRSLAGTRVAQDFVELPSQIMENWCSERDALNLFAAHYETGAPLPEALLERLRQTRTFRAASMQMRQLGFAAVDLAMHIDYSPEVDGDVMDYGNRILQRYAASELPQDYGMLAGFLHLFSHPVGYAAGYYSYKWAEVLDADAFGRFKREGVFNGTVGRAFRDSILAQGDARDPMDLFVAFMGRKPDPQALLVRQGLAA
ncbi:MAG TPA: M3 family metallopeptidase [Polyangiaceae bacterium]|nr:M3 family metallopeptidase [Polyangiaceae bacterium]